MKIIKNKVVILIGVIFVLAISIGTNIYQSVQIHSFYQSFTKSSVYTMKIHIKSSKEILGDAIKVNVINSQDLYTLHKSFMFLTFQSEELEYLSKTKNGLEFSPYSTNNFTSISNFFIHKYVNYPGSKEDPIVLDEKLSRQIETIHKLTEESFLILDNESVEFEEILNRLSQRIEDFTNSLEVNDIAF
ncbi:hypothetical protein GCM10008967_28150 [Bacillus carboniphilus]|uniref:Uncharacterized protein n=1 Tax=Bacillus carboniphilus TaxID=86663 RepID=A0ABN0WFR9_9BACI